jgi:hypothetical protein
MGDGWGDFFAISMTSQPADDFAGGVFPVGGWTASRQSSMTTTTSRSADSPTARTPQITR